MQTTGFESKNVSKNESKKDLKKDSKKDLKKKKDMKNKFENISWKVIESYFKDKYLTRLVRHQLESYNYFIEKQLFDTIKMFNPVKIHSEKEKEETGQYLIEIIINFSNLKILRPQIHENNGATKIMFPHEARLRNFTYSSQITVDLNIKILRKSGKDFKKIETIFKNIPSIHIGKIPIMLKSNICVLKQFSHYNTDITKECNHDPGGYFIISGSEKTILAQERAAENNVMCFNIKKNNNKWSWLAEIKSIPLDKCISPKQINVTISTRNYGDGHNIDISIPRIKQPIPIFILFRALGIVSDKDITNYILLNNKAKGLKQMLFGLKASIICASKYKTQEECFDYIVNYVMYTPIKMTKEMGELKKREFTKSVLENDLFPHCPSKTEKIYFLGYMINKLLRTSFGWRKPDDRDSYSNKRLDLAGSLINNLFRNYFNKLVKDMQKQIIREINNGSWQSTDNVQNIINQTNIYKIIKSTTIENGIKRALATGDFGIKNTNSQKVGVAQVLNRLTYISTLSHLRRINTPIDKSGKLIPPRKLHNTQWGFICPAETPEGQSVGVVKNISYMAHITIKSQVEPILNILKDKIIKLDEEITFEDLFDKVKVFVNGCWIGIAKNPIQLYKKLKYYKYTGIFNIYTSITFNIKDKEIFICNDAGRLCRPLYKVKNNKLLINKKAEKFINNECDWDELCVNHALSESIIEYVDSAEQNSSLIAIKPSKLKSDEKLYYNFTHCEIHPSTIFGILGSCIPFPEHNQSPRNTYQCIDWNESVIMSNGKNKKLRDIQIGDSVLTFDPKTKITSSTDVVMHMNRHSGDRQMYEIETVAGEKIKATCDHKFMTSEGWMKTEDFTTDTEIGMYKIPVFDNITSEEIAISRDMLLNQNNWNFSKRDINRLDKLGLFDIKYNNYKIKLIAKMFGFIMTDCSTNIYTKGPMTQCYFTSPEAAEEFENDVELLGFGKKKIFESIRTFHGSTHNTWKTMHCGLLSKFFIALNITMGKRTENPHKPIPEWIKGNDTLIKCFLSGFLGGDGCRIYYYEKEPSIRTRNLSFNKVDRYMDNGIKFMEDMKYCLTRVGIETGDIINFTRNDRDTNIIQLMVSSRHDNLIKLFDEVGYSYDNHKQMSSAKAVVWLKYKALMKERNIVIDKSIDKRNIFINDIKTQHTTLFEPILSIKKVEGCMISDLTTRSENHSFILARNGVLSQNCAMGKQAMGTYTTNFQERMDKTAYVQTYTMRPLVDTRLMNIIKLNQIPSGSMVIVAIMTYSGYNQEDSIIFNEGSIERGLFSATIYKTEKDEDKNIHGDEEIRCKADKTRTKGIKFANYDKLNENGIIPENTLIENRDIIIGKVVPIKENRNDPTKLMKYKDYSKIYRTNEPCFVDKNYINRNGDGYTFAKIRTRTYRIPNIGDKFCLKLTSRVLTDVGWIQLKDIDIKKHKVATLQNGTELDYVYPVNKYEFDCVDEELYHIQNKQINMICTKNHRLYIQKRDRKNFEFMEAKDAFGKMVRYKKDAVNIYPDQEHICFGSVEYLMNSWLKLLGIYIADGSRCERQIKLCGLKPRKKEFMMNTCDELGIDYSICDEGIRISGAKYPEIVDNLINKKAHEKYLPDYVWNLSQFQSRVLMDSLMRCDGHTYKNNSGFSRYGTVSIKLANDIQKLALHCGWSSIIKLAETPGLTRAGVRNLGKRKGEKVSITLRHNYYKISIIRKQNNPWVNKKKNDTNKEEYIKYTGKVGCIEVPDTHLFYYKEDEFSPPCWSGNSSRHGQQATVMPKALLVQSIGLHFQTAGTSC